MSDGSRATLTNLPTERAANGGKDQDVNHDGDDESNNSREIPLSSRLTKLSRSRSRSQSPAIFPPAPSSALFQNAQRFNNSRSQYSSDASESGSTSVRQEPRDRLPTPSSESKHNNRPKSQGAYSKRRDRRHRTLTSVPPPTVPRLSATNRSFSGSGQNHSETNSPTSEKSFPIIKINVGKQKSQTLPENNKINENPELRHGDVLKLPAQSTFGATTQEAPKKDNEDPRLLQIQGYTDIPLPQLSHRNGDKTSNNNEIPDTKTYQSGSEAVVFTTSSDPSILSPEATNCPSTDLRKLYNQARVGEEDAAPNRDSLRDLVPGTVSGIVQQINKLSPASMSPSSNSTDKSNGTASSSGSYGNGSCENLHVKGSLSETEEIGDVDNASEVLLETPEPTVSNNASDGSDNHLSKSDNHKPSNPSERLNNQLQISNDHGDRAESPATSPSAVPNGVATQEHPASLDLQATGSSAADAGTSDV
ncbi:hypothetical protein EGW08_009991 [Elysia chlorotica]|uniref:Uncharacterized protein n=1 Tax=Elysia chlorotica TaxID=188477 RepID=A0A433TKX6_ELYCH|nr:hypothetical protein EGW08_009991 [Elysia chlorotica]